MKLKIEEWMEPIIGEYYSNNARKLYGIVDNIIRKYGGISDKDKDDFYSLANEVFVISLRDYNNSIGSFDGYLYSNMVKKIITSIRDRNRGKRSNTRPQRDKNGEFVYENGKPVYEFVPDISIETPVGDDDSGTIGDFILDNFDVEEKILEKKREIYSDKMMQYLERLSELQKEILRLTIAGYIASEIIEELHITQKEYSDCNAAIHSYRNVSVLF